jgi:ubiquinone/menaquinone biosynthesis C-methylase UbiE
MRPQSKKTSWHHVGGWYNKLVADRGQYYHEHLVLPQTLKLLSLNESSSLLDLACGNGVLARQLKKQIVYQGVDIARSLISAAQAQNKNPSHRFTVGDITQTLPINKTDFSHAAIILAIQNIKETQTVFTNTARYLSNKGKLVVVLNHPCFRIPRQSSWEIDAQSKLQYRRINRYLTPLEIPITTHPGKENSPVTWSFHQPLSAYIKQLAQAGFYIETLEEWASDKESVGKMAKMENRSRAEFPLFLAIVAVKK